MTDDQNPPPTSHVEQLEVLLEQVRDARNKIQEVHVGLERNQQRQEKLMEVLEQFRQTVIAPVQDIVIAQEKLRAVLLNKMDGMQGDLDLLRENMSAGQDKLRQDVSTAQDKLRAALLRLHPETSARTGGVFGCMM